MDPRDSNPLHDQEASLGRCRNCEQALGLEGGYAGTGLCGPCATGESETLNEIGETWGILLPALIFAAGWGAGWVCAACAMVVFFELFRIASDKS